MSTNSDRVAFSALIVYFVFITLCFVIGMAEMWNPGTLNALVDWLLTR